MKTSEKRLYVENSISQQGILLYILGNTVFTIFYVNHMDVDFQLGIFILLNIFLSLFAFLMAVRQKLYASQVGLCRNCVGGISICSTGYGYRKKLPIPKTLAIPIDRYRDVGICWFNAVISVPKNGRNSF